MTESTITEIGGPFQWLPVSVYAPRSPVSVNIDGIDVDDYELVDGRLWRRGGWVVQGEPSHVTSRLEHGLQTVPADIVNRVRVFVAAVIAVAGTGDSKPRGRQHRRLDDNRRGL